MKKIISVLLTLLIFASCNNQLKDVNKNEDLSSKNTITSEQDKSLDNVSEDNKSKPVEKNNENSNKDALFPPYSLKNLEGEEIDNSHYEGKYTLYSFFATWCHYCRDEHKELDHIRKEVKDMDIVLVDVGEDLDVVKQYIDENNIDADVLLDKDSKLAQTIGVPGFPTSILVNKDGKVIFAVNGLLPTDEFTKQLNDAIKKDQ